MYLKTITLDPASPGIPLPFLVTGLGSDAVLLTLGVPEGFRPIIAFKFTGFEEAQYTYGTQTVEGIWQLVIPGWNFTVAETSTYEISCKKIEGEGGFFAGRGCIQVMDTFITGEIPAAPGPVPLYFLDPVTGMKYAALATVNEIGQVTGYSAQLPLNPPAQG